MLNLHEVIKAVLLEANFHHTHKVLESHPARRAVSPEKWSFICGIVAADLAYPHLGR